MGRSDFADQFRIIIIRHKSIANDLNVMRQSACLMIHPITVINSLLPSLIARWWIGRQTL